MRVGAIQTTAGPVPEANLDRAAVLVSQASRHGAALVVLPEYFSVAGSPTFLRNHAEPLDGPTARWASEQAAKHRIHLVAGSFPERPVEGTRTGNRLFNTSCLFGPDGALEAVYRKLHLFDVTLAGARVCESATMAPGDSLAVVPLGADADPGGRHSPVLGLSICYDLRFPEPYRIMALQGATVMAVPAAFTAATGPAHWELLLRARAVENEVFVVGAGQVGVLPPGMPACHGHTMIVDPWGVVVAECTDNVPGVALADLDMARLDQVRSELPVLAHRRPAAYRWPDDNSRGAVGTGG
ncbi:MAG TPA: carbon-nitrogen hydrolase family protein [Acidimicrobiales bacterium]|jgi:predicted amidohydrolase|nr:carbon-nitrogen hydrolase family protein [Acidimicrobiales bacterium]